MKFKAFVYVSLKTGYSDPEGETTAHALRGLGYSVNDVRSSKAYEVTFKAADQAKSEKLLDEMCRRLLTNPTKDDYRFEISELK
jgi:phosphoribosylformylglycinamidine synthase PurS subunit